MTGSVFDVWADKLLTRLSERDVEHTDRARQLLVMAMEAQTVDGPGASPEQIVAWLDRFPLDDIATLYVTKYDARRLTFNRCVRLLADLHELWIDARMPEPSV